MLCRKVTVLSLRRARIRSSPQGEHLGYEYDVVLKSPAFTGIEANKSYVLRVAYESLSLLDPENRSQLLIFKYQDIICWGSTAFQFQFKCFGDACPDWGKQKNEFVPVLFTTSHGKELERVTLSTVKSLMSDMDKTAVSKEDFITLKGLLGQGEEGEFLETVKQFATARCYTSHQGVELLDIAQDVDPFSRLELAIFLYDNILNKFAF